MTEKRNEGKRETFLILIQKGNEDKFRTYKKVCRKLGKSVNSRICELIDQDAEKLFAIIEIISKGEKEK